MDNCDKTAAIVLKSLRYGDSSLIVKALTREFGLQSYLIKGAFGKKSKLSPAFFQTMTLIDVVVTPSNSDLVYLNEVSLSRAYHNIPYDINKNAIIIFISELLSNTVIETEINKELFDFVYQSLIWLDDIDNHYANFPLFFSLRLTGYLGFSPNISSYNDNSYFDFEEGCFRDKIPEHQYYIDIQHSIILHKFCSQSMDSICEISISNNSRRILMESVITYYKLHINGFKDLRSYEIIKMIL